MCRVLRTNNKPGTLLTTGVCAMSYGLGLCMITLVVKGTSAVLKVDVHQS